MAIFKNWRLECTTCHQITTHMGWDSEQEQFPQQCECGGALIEEYLLKRVGGVIPDDLPGGMVLEHIEPGRKIYSRSELKLFLKQRGYQLTDCWSGSPTDQHMSRWV